MPAVQIPAVAAAALDDDLDNATTVEMHSAVAVPNTQPLASQFNIQDPDNAVTLDHATAVTASAQTPNVAIADAAAVPTSDSNDATNLKTGSQPPESERQLRPSEDGDEESEEGACNECLSECGENDACVKDCECANRECDYFIARCEIEPWRSWYDADGTIIGHDSMYKTEDCKPTIIQERRQVDYEHCTGQELKGFVHDRGLDDPFSAGQTLKCYYIKALQRADREWTFRFMDLPPEMRNLVYAQLLLFSPNTCPYHKRLHAQILRTCKEIYGEAKDILYTDNTFHVDFTTSYNSDEEVPSHTAGAYVHRKVIIARGFSTVFSDLYHGIDEYPEFLTRVRSLKVSLFCYDIELEDPDPRECYEYLHHCLLTLASFLMDSHVLTKLEIDTCGVDCADHGVLASILYPLRRLRNISEVTICSALCNTVEQSIVHDIQSTRPSINTLKYKNLIEAEAAGYLTLAIAVRATMGYLIDEDLDSEFPDRVEVIDAHLAWIAWNMVAGLGMFANAEEEKVLQIRLAKIHKLLPSTDMRRMADNLENYAKRKDKTEDCLRDSTFGSVLNELAECLSEDDDDW